jgi:hypothetical protein
VPVAAALQDTVAEPEPEIEVFEIVLQVSPVAGLSERLTLPPKPFTGAIVIVEIEAVSLPTVAGEDAVMVKSWKLKVVVAEWD